VQDCSRDGVNESGNEFENVGRELGLKVVTKDGKHLGVAVGRSVGFMVGRKVMKVEGL